MSEPGSGSDVVSMRCRVDKQDGCFALNGTKISKNLLCRKPQPILCCVGDHVGALAMSEPGSGSDVVSMRCRADKQDGCFVLNGTKMWCTNGTVANTLVVYARTEQDKGPHGITAFIIEKGMKVCVHYAQQSCTKKLACCLGCTYIHNNAF